MTQFQFFHLYILEKHTYISRNRESIPQGFATWMYIGLIHEIPQWNTCTCRLVFDFQFINTIMKLRICLSFETENNSISGTLQLAFPRLSNRRLITEWWLGCLKFGLVIKIHEIYTVRHACLFSFVNNTP